MLDRSAGGIELSADAAYVTQRLLEAVTTKDWTLADPSELGVRLLDGCAPLRRVLGVALGASAPLAALPFGAQLQRAQLLLATRRLTDMRERLAAAAPEQQRSAPDESSRSVGNETAPIEPTSTATEATSAPAGEAKMPSYRERIGRASRPPVAPQPTFDYRPFR